MGTLLREVVDASEYAARRNGNVLVLTMSTVAQSVATDGAKLKQCLFNLLSNASKFTHDGLVGRAVSFVDDRRRIRFVVTDSGVGMSPEQMERIFNPFVQAETDTHHSFGGTGPGLSVSRELARLLGGDITVASAPGQGSTFTLEIAACLDTGRMASASSGDAQAA